MLGVMLAGFVVLGVPQGGAKMTAVQLRCESSVDPLGVDVPHPRLSWVLDEKSSARDLKQVAYQVLVAPSLTELQKDRGTLWDSGRVATSSQNNIVYGGRALRFGQQCFWKVKVWGSNGLAGWSKPARWEMGPMVAGDWLGRWISDGKVAPTSDADFYKDNPNPLFRREFGVKGQVSRARLAIAGLGYYEASLNGTKVGDHVLDPGWTRVEDRVLYSVYDVTRQLAKGENCLGVMLGDGWYNPLPLRLFGSFNLRNHLTVGRPRVIAQLQIEYKDGSSEVVATDEAWRVGEGPLLRNNVYLGEVYDARKEQTGWDRAGFDDQRWRNASAAVGDVGRLISQSQPPIRVTSTWDSVKMTSPKPGVFIYDMGVNFAGWVQLKTDLLAGNEVRLRYGELLSKDGSLNPFTSVAGQIKYKRKETGESVGGPGAPEVAVQSDTFIAKGGKETYTPKFTYHGFRYVEVTGLPAPVPLSSVRAMRLNSDVESVGNFECSNTVLNDIQTMCRRTFLSNIFSVQSDCPHREKLGYGGDIVATSEAFMANFDMAGFYAKAIRDWSDSAEADGMFTDTAPSMGIQYCGLVWAMAPVLLADQLHQYYGDQEIGATEYAAAKRWMDLIEAKYPRGIVTDGLSDHEGLAETPSAPLVTPHYFQTANLMAKTAARIGKAADSLHYAALAKSIQRVYVAEFFDETTGRVGPGTQTSQSVGLYTDIVPESSRSKALVYLVDEIHKAKDHLTTGILGTKYMLQVLSEAGETELAYKIATQSDFPGWGWMLKNGATTLWEHWDFSDNTFSHNHPMFGSVSQWMMNWLGGIQPDSSAVGYDQIVIRPQTPKGLDWVDSSYRSVRGQITSNWKRVGDSVRFEIEIPPNSSAGVVLPSGSHQVSFKGNRPFPQVERLPNGSPTFRVGSGSYVFDVR
jgi:alpha-L-rhamnosidase